MGEFLVAEAKGLPSLAPRGVHRSPPREAALSRAWSATGRTGSGTRHPQAPQPHSRAGATTLPAAAPNGPKRHSSTGKTSKFISVEVTKPPRMTMAMGP